MLTRVYARSYLCSALDRHHCSTDSAKLACTWTGETCQSADLDAWNWYMTHPFLDQAPAWMFCPKSQAHQAKVCLDLGTHKSSCAKRAGCSWNKADGICQASFFVAMSLKQRDAWSVKFSTLHPSVHGACSSACYLRRQAAGKLPSQYDSDAWGHAAEAADAACGAQSSGSRCRKFKQGPARPRFGTTRVSSYVKWVQSDTKVKCSV